MFVTGNWIAASPPDVVDRLPWLPATTDDWRVQWCCTEDSDMEIVAVAACGPHDGYMWLVCNGECRAGVTAVIACLHDAMTKTTMPVVTDGESAAGVLRFLGIDCSLFQRVEDGFVHRTGDDDRGLHDAAPVVRDLPLALDEEGEEA